MRSNKNVKDSNLNTKNLTWKVLPPPSITYLTYFRLITLGT